MSGQQISLSGVNMNFISLLQNLITYLFEASVLALVTFGIVIIFRTSFTTNFAQGMIASTAAYITTFAFHEWINKGFSSLDPLLKTTFAFIPGILSGFIFGILIDKLLIRRAKYTTILTKQMITMGIVLFLTGLLPTLFASYEQSATGMPSFPRFSREVLRVSLGNGVIRLQVQHIYSVSIAVIVITGVFLALKFTKWGLGVRATAANELVSGMMGINTRKITALSWGVAAALGSIGGLLFAAYQTVSVSMMVTMQVTGFLAAVLGGFSSFIGPVIGAIIIPLLVYASYQITGIVGGDSLRVYDRVFVYLIILIIILIKPVGLFGKKIAKKV